VESLGSNGYSPPGDDQIEVSVFGPGYGECIVLHLGFNDWLVVDSCIDAKTGRPVAISYLEALGIDLATSVRIVVATHWDDDHVNGLSEVFRTTQQAKFACSAAMSSHEFTALVAAWRPSRYLPGGSGIDEFWDILHELKRRAASTSYPTPVRASDQKVIWERPEPRKAEVRALSPSDAAEAAAIARFSDAVAGAAKERRRLPRIEDNHASVVLSVRLAGVNVLLGSDLQVRADRGLGWLAVVDGHAGVVLHGAIKLPHHGSSNGYHPEVWEKLLGPKPIAAATSYVGGGVRLPTLEDCRRVLQHTSLAFMTARPIPRRFRDRDRTVEKTLREVTKQVYFSPGQFGHVRLRRKIAPEGSEDWQVTLFGDALCMQDFNR
jgi:Metallo-beta-lactamase superfamily